MKTFTESMIELLSHPNLSKYSFLLKLYDSRTAFWNYSLICLVGVVINQIALHFFVGYFPLWIANFCSILLAWSWNYLNAIGYLSKYW